MCTRIIMTIAHEAARLGRGRRHIRNETLAAVWNYVPRKVKTWLDRKNTGEEDEEQNILPFLPGDVVDIELFGISRDYYNYIEILTDQLGGVGLFEPTPVAVKGNCINITNPENYAFGYFRVNDFLRVQLESVPTKISNSPGSAVNSSLLL